MTRHTTSAMESAWQHYFDTIAELKRLTFNQSWMAHPDARKAGHYHLAQMLAVGYNNVIAPKQDYPVFYDHLYAEPMVYNWGMKTPDFLTRYAFVNGNRTYRIWGKRGTTSWFEFSVYGYYMSEPPEKVSYIGTYDLDDFAQDTDGHFEIIASSRAHSGNWIQLEPDSPNNALHVRELCYDWVNEEPTEVHIETVDDLPPHPMLFDESEMIRRLEGAARLMRIIVENFVIGEQQRIRTTAGVNAFAAPTPIKPKSGTNPGAKYVNAVYEIAPDEALIIEMPDPAAKYWNIMVTDAWQQATDYIHHQSSLNGRQAVADSDGKYRMVLCKEDPGVPNWLDPVDSLVGFIGLRLYFAERLVIPTITRVASAEVREYLPKDTGAVTPEQRANALVTRRRAGLKRFHH